MGALEGGRTSPGVGVLAVGAVGAERVVGAGGVAGVGAGLPRGRLGDVDGALEAQPCAKINRAIRPKKKRKERSRRDRPGILKAMKKGSAEKRRDERPRPEARVSLVGSSAVNTSEARLRATGNGDRLDEHGLRTYPERARVSIERAVEHQHLQCFAVTHQPFYLVLISFVVPVAARARLGWKRRKRRHGRWEEVRGDGFG